MCVAKVSPKTLLEFLANSAEIKDMFQTSLGWYPNIPKSDQQSKVFQRINRHEMTTLVVAAGSTDTDAAAAATSSNVILMKWSFWSTKQRVLEPKESRTVSTSLSLSLSLSLYLFSLSLSSFSLQMDRINKDHTVSSRHVFRLSSFLLSLAPPLPLLYDENPDRIDQTRLIVRIIIDIESKKEGKE